ncbi:MAG: hypothetical protein LAP85_22300 [Acidobacteriia bacterium]|nr:hypothetical protein [Terriglobia bacterium]
MSESSQSTGTQSNPWVGLDPLPPDVHRSFWSILAWPFGWFHSTSERRLVFYRGATAQVRPVGRFLLPLSEALARPQSTRRRPIFRIGWVAMTPSVRELPVASIWSLDGIEFTATFSFVLTPLDKTAAIARLACGGSEEEKRVVNILQKATQSVLVEMDADMALASLSDVFTRIQHAVEESLSAVDLPFSVLEPRVESCRPTDPEVAMTSLERQRLRSEALLEAERSKQAFERAEREALARARQLENERKEKEAELQRADMQRVFELRKMISEAEAAIERDQLKATAAPKILELTATAEAGRDRIKTAAAVDAEGLIEEQRVKIAKLKAELARTPEGLRVLYPQQSFDLEKERVRYATTIMTELRALYANGAFLGGQYTAMKQILEKTMNVQLREFNLPSPTEPLLDPLSDGPKVQGDAPNKDAPTTAPGQGQQTNSNKEVRNEETPA